MGPWDAASCSRHDLQSFFLPSSPFVITREEFANAPTLTTQVINVMRSTGAVDDKYKNERVIEIASFAGQNGNLGPLTIKSAILDTIRSMNDMDDDMMKKYANRMGRWTVDHAATLYVMRPNDFCQAQLRDRMNKLFPSGFDLESAIGLPIRGISFTNASFVVCTTSLTICACIYSYDKGVNATRD
jgi:hypothetical protein